MQNTELKGKKYQGQMINIIKRQWKFINKIKHQERTIYKSKNPRAVNRLNNNA